MKSSFVVVLALLCSVNIIWASDNSNKEDEVKNKASFLAWSAWRDGEEVRVDLGGQGANDKKHNEEVKKGQSKVFGAYREDEVKQVLILSNRDKVTATLKRVESKCERLCGGGKEDEVCHWEAVYDFPKNKGEPIMIFSGVESVKFIKADKWDELRNPKELILKNIDKEFDITGWGGVIYSWRQKEGNIVLHRKEVYSEATRKSSGPGNPTRITLNSCDSAKRWKKWSLIDCNEKGKLLFYEDRGVLVSGDIEEGGILQLLGEVDVDGENYFIIFDYLMRKNMNVLRSIYRDGSKLLKLKEGFAYPIVC